MNYAKLVILLWCITFSVEELCTVNGSTGACMSTSKCRQHSGVHTEDIVKEEMTFNVAPMKKVIVFLKKDVVELS